MNHYAGGRTVVDVGCSIGVGANIMSHTARHVWGIDVNEESINFAKQVFERPNLSFDLYDIEHPSTREFAKFELVTCIEVVEHLKDLEMGLSVIKKFFSGDLNTVGFITIPNIANEEIKDVDAKNELHLNHWNAGEFYELMIKHFRSVTLYSADKVNMWDQEETVDGNSTDRLIIARVEGVING
jgi:cyclopropane fatty-acyl-phospholipid synthase-like methyltransferase